MTISNALDNAEEKILIGLKCSGLCGSGSFATGTTLEIFHEAGKHPAVMEVLNIWESIEYMEITGRMERRKNLINFSGTSCRPITFEPI
jgi:hypothetical protein